MPPRLLHFTAIDPDLRPVEYIVITEEDEIADLTREGYKLDQQAEILDSVTSFPTERPLWPR